MRSVLLSSVFVLVSASAALAVDFNVPDGTTDTVQKTLNGTDTLTVEGPNGKLSVNNTAVTSNNVSTGVAITNSGTIESTQANGRAINFAAGGAATRNLTLTNNAGGLIQSQDDTFRINLDVTTGNIAVNNSGTILSSVGGQALDFDAIAAGTASVSINNFATGTIQAKGQDAMRPGQAAVVTNFGMICGGDIVGGTCQGGALGNNFDGVDWQGKSGTLINKTGGIISSVRHGTTSDVNVNVTNEAGALIIGRNGSGVGSDGNGTVINHGTITGAYDGVSANGDGDGVDIDHDATIVNFGTIQGTGAAGVDSGGQPNGSEGIAIGRGSVANNAGALISGASQGILVDDGAGGAADGATTITNAGTIRGLAGAGIKLVGGFADTINNSGTISGVGAAALDMGAGDDSLNLSTGSTIQGVIDGGADFDTLDIAGNVTLGGEVVNFEKLILEAGAELNLAFDLHIDQLLGAIVDGDEITNIVGNGFNVFYDPLDAANAYLLGRNYLFAGGGELSAGLLLAAPEPATLGLLVPGLLYLLRARIGRRPSLNSRRRSGLCM